MIQKIWKNNDKKLDTFMIMMQKTPLDLDLKWAIYEFCKMVNKLEEHGQNNMNKQSQPSWPVARS